MRVDVELLIAGGGLTGLLLGIACAGSGLDVAVVDRQDPVALLAGGIALDREVDAVLASFSDKPFIFNLGHGILPETPIEHVERMVARVRKSCQ